MVKLSSILKLVVCVLCLGNLAFAQCTDCSDFQGRCKGYTTSACTQECICTGERSGLSYLHELHPGFFTKYDTGRLVVAAVLPGSSASQIGIFPGDEIRLINGRMPFTFDCPAKSWGKLSSANPVEVTLSRNGREFIRQVPLLPVHKLLGAAWARGGRGLNVQLVGMNSGALNTGAHVFVFGFRFLKKEDSLVVTDLLHGSPAEEAGVQIGDHIVSIDGVGISEASREAVGALYGADHRAKFTLGVLRGSREVYVQVSANGVSEILRRWAKRQADSALEVAEVFQP